jgi:hypothetical protein
MRKLILYIFIFFALTGSFACEEEYKDFKVEKYEPVVVIEGLITDNNPPYFVKVSRTTFFGDSSYNKSIANLEVRMTDNEGNTELLSIQEPGVYRSDSLQGKPGNTYKLEVRIRDSVFISNCVMPPAIVNDSLISVYHKDDGIYKQGYHVKLIFRKPQNDSINYYKCNIYQNGKLITNRLYSIIFSDDNTSSKLEVEFLESFSFHDTVELEVMTINKEVYNYFFDIDKIISNDSYIFDYQRNPRSNISNGAFGYFQASSVKRLKLVIK